MEAGQKGMMKFGLITPNLRLISVSCYHQGYQQHHRHQPAYQKFTGVFRNRVAANSSLLDDLVPNPENLSRQGNDDKSRLISDPGFLWPPACRGCYKTLGF
jgi:hypothetical protein